MAEDRRLFGITEDWSTATLDPGVWYSTVREGDCRFMAAWVKEEEKASANFLDSGTGFWEFNYAGEACEARVY